MRKAVQWLVLSLVAQTAFGQRYDVRRQLVYKVEVTATDSKGDAVNLRWLAGRGSAGRVQTPPSR